MNDLDFENHLKQVIRFYLLINQIFMGSSIIYFLRLIKLIVIESYYL